MHTLDPIFYKKKHHFAVGPFYLAPVMMIMTLTYQYDTNVYTIIRSGHLRLTPFLQIKRLVIIIEVIFSVNVLMTYEIFS